MSTLEEMPKKAHKEDVQLTKKEKFHLFIGFSAIACGILLAFGFGVYVFGADTTINAIVGVLVFGAVVSLGAVVCFRIFGRTR